MEADDRVLVKGKEFLFRDILKRSLWRKLELSSRNTSGSAYGALAEERVALTIVSAIALIIIFSATGVFSLIRFFFAAAAHRRISVQREKRGLQKQSDEVDTQYGGSESHVIKLVKSAIKKS